MLECNKCDSKLLQSLTSNKRRLKDHAKTVHDEKKRKILKVASLNIGTGLY